MVPEMHCSSAELLCMRMLITYSSYALMPPLPSGPTGAPGEAGAQGKQGETGDRGTRRGHKVHSKLRTLRTQTHLLHTTPWCQVSPWESWASKSLVTFPQILWFVHFDFGLMADADALQSFEAHRAKLEILERKAKLQKLQPFHQDCKRRVDGEAEVCPCSFCRTFHKNVYSIIICHRLWASNLPGEGICFQSNMLLPIYLYTVYVSSWTLGSLTYLICARPSYYELSSRPNCWQQALLQGTSRPLCYGTTHGSEHSEISRNVSWRMGKSVAEQAAALTFCCRRSGKDDNGWCSICSSSGNYGGGLILLHASRFFLHRKKSRRVKARHLFL